VVQKLSLYSKFGTPKSGARKIKRIAFAEIQYQRQLSRTIMEAGNYYFSTGFLYRFLLS
jgi:hypothetical protein